MDDEYCRDSRAFTLRLRVWLNILASPLRITVKGSGSGFENTWVRGEYE